MLFQSRLPLHMLGGERQPMRLVMEAFSRALAQECEFLVATTGAFFAGYLALWLFPDLYAVGMTIGAFIGAVGLLYFVRFKKRR